MDSPFDNGYQVAWDSTSLGWYKQCPRYYYYTMIEGYRSKQESVHLTFGIHFHSALETYDNAVATGDSHDAALRRAVRRTLTDSSGWESDHVKNRYTLIRTVVHYLDHFRDHPAKTIILSNGAPAVELSFRFDIGDGLMLCGHLDKMVSFQGDNYVIDRKTTSSTVGPYYFDKYSPDNQFSLYTLAGRVIYNVPLSGVILDAVQIAVGFSRFERGLVHRSEATLNEWLRDARFWIAQAHKNTEANYYPQNDKACHNYGGCVFRGICSKDPRVRQTFLEAGFEKKPWNPLEVR